MTNLLNKTIALSATLLCAAMACANPITPQKAQTIAKPFMAAEYIQPRLVKKAERKSRVKLAANYDAVAPYYIYSRGEGQGFVIVSGDDCVPEVLGYTESGDFDADNLPPFLVWYLDYYGTSIEQAQANNAPRFKAPKYAAPRTDIKELIKTNWHQDAPYNDLCPTRKDGGGRCVTGCVATAASQVAYYWHKDLPHETQGATSSYIYGSQATATKAFPKGTPLKWELMRTDYNSEPAEYREAVAILMAVVGGGAGLTYGSSTSGYNDNCRSVFSNILGLYGGQENAKDWGESYNNYSDEAWSTLLYNDLIKSRPILYSGCNDNGEGHAVVVDGYKAATDLFHFNLGWGNPSAYNGYFTVARGQSPSWGFNTSYQECVTGVYPKKQNLTAKVELPLHSYLNTTNKLKVNIRNNGTLPYSGIYVFVNTSGNKPTSASSAKSGDLETVFPADGSENIIELEYKPSSEKTNYVIITDKNLNVLTTVEMTPEVPLCDLRLEDIYMDASSVSQSFSGNDYAVVYGAKPIAKVRLANHSNVACEGTLHLDIAASEDEGKTFSDVGNKSSKFSIAAGATETIEVAMTSSSSCPINEGKLYVCTFESALSSASTAEEITIPDGVDSQVRFLLKPSTLKAVSMTDGCVKFTGDWDPNQFQTLAKKSTYKSANSYDLTEVKNIKYLSASPVNANAVYYVSDDCKAEGVNIIRNGLCNELTLVPSANFSVREDFTAKKASITLNQLPNRWYLLTTPCDLLVPAGMAARQITGHSTSSINNKYVDVDTLLAGHTYMVMTSSSGNQVISGINAHVSASVAANPDTAFVGTYVGITTPENALLMDMEDEQYFRLQPQGTFVEALRGYFCASNLKKDFRANASQTLDPIYQQLGEAIENAYIVRADYRELVSDEVYLMMSDSISKAEALFTSRELTAIDARKALKSLTDFTEEFKMMVETLGNKTVDFTAYIKNPSFEASTATIRNWTFEAQTASIYKSSNLSHQAVGMDGGNLVESNVDGRGSELSQTVEGLTPGYYTLSAMVGSDVNNTITLFAGEDSVTVSANPLGKYYLTEARIERVRVGDDGVLTLGIKAGDWYKADDFRLTLTEITYSTDIDEVGMVAPINKNKGVYDLTGRKLDASQLRHGIYIVNGKKVMNY